MLSVARPLLSLLVAISCLGTLSADDQFVHPLDAVVAEDGTVYVVDRKLPGVWRSTREGFEPFVRGGKKFRTPLNAVRCLALDAKGQLLVGDSATREVYRIDAKGAATGLTAAKPETPGRIGIPMDIAVDTDGVIHVSDLESHRIWRIPAAGGEPVEFATVPAPRGIAFDAKGRLWVVSHGPDQLLAIDTAGKVEVVAKGRPFKFPHDVVHADGRAYVTDGYGKAVLEVTEGQPPKPLHTGDPLQNPVGLALHGRQLLVVDPRAKHVFRRNEEGTLEPFDPAAPRPE